MPSFNFYYSVFSFTKLFLSTFFPFFISYRDKPLFSAQPPYGELAMIIWSISTILF